jgi:hypothetical protein
MQVITVLKSFVLAAEGKVREFATGVHEVEESIASHWFVKAHSEAVAVETKVETEVKTDETKTVAAVEAPVVALEEKVEAAVAAIKKTK